MTRLTDINTIAVRLEILIRRSNDNDHEANFHWRTSFLLHIRRHCIEYIK